MEQPNRTPQMPRRAAQPPVVSGMEPRRQRTGVAWRTTAAQRTMPTGRAAGATGTPVPRAEADPPDRPCPPEEGTGVLPCSAPLANPYVPFQRANPQRYTPQRGLARGTLYPGLELPLMGMVNGDQPQTPLTELMALQFAVTELGLYLDTHPEDEDALAVFRTYADRAAEAQARYEQTCGPLRQQDAATGGSWDWVCNPWPWDLCQEG